MVQCNFDLDFRLKGDPKSEELSIKFSNENIPIQANIHFNQRHRSLEEIDDDYLNFMNEKGMKIFHDFLRDPKKTELFELLLTTINLFGDALTENILHKRIINLFTIMELLLLKDKNVPILDSLKKYLPILITDNIEVRKEIKENIDKLYEIRSKAIHHSKYEDFQVEQLAKLQEYLFLLLKKLIQLSDSFETKDQVLSEIDRAINSVIWELEKS